MYESNERTEHISRELLLAGRSIVQTGGVARMIRRQLTDGTYRTEAKVTDTFHFVFRPWFCTDASDRTVLRSGCNCGVCDCEHLAALLLTAAPDAISVPDIPPAPAASPAVSPVPSMPAVPIVPPAIQVTQPEPAALLQPRSMEICFGSELPDQVPVYWHPNDTERVFHTNMGIIGTMGTGKTQFTKSVVTQLYRSQQDNFDGSPLGILIFDYKGDYNETKKDFIQATNARVLKPYRLPYNPLALHRTDAFRPLLPIHTANEFKDTISKIYNLGAKQQHLLFDCIVKAYAHQGIDPAIPSTWDRPAPTFEQVYQIYLESSADRPMDSLSAAMDIIHQFCLFEGDPRMARSLGQILRGVVVIDLSGYDQNIQSLIVSITLDQFYAYMHKIGSSRTDGRYRQLRNMILVDEADTFMDQGFPSLKKILKEGREFGVGVILSTQSLSHFVGGDDDYSRYVLTWVIHNVNDLKQRDVEYVFKLQPRSPEILEHYAAIKGLNKHESIMKRSNDAPITVRDKAFWQLFQELFQ